MRSRLSVVLALCACLPACRSTPPSPSQRGAAPYVLYRFDDNLTAAAVSAPRVPASAPAGAPVVWRFADRKITWKLARGRMGFRKTGELVVQGEGSTPVIVSPSEPPIDWSRYEALLIRMIQEEGKEIKIKVGRLELRQPLARPMQYRVYRFDLSRLESSFTRPLAIMPTDSLFAPVAIDFIELVPRKTRLTDPVGRRVVGKQEEYRSAIYAHAPSSITYEVPIPKNASLHVGLGVLGSKPVTFRILAGASRSVIFSRRMDNPDAWEDAAVDLSAFEGRTTPVVLETSSEAEGAVGLWANPLLTNRAAAGAMNVLLYVVCTLRPDHTSLYGYARDTTPFLKKYGASGVVFDDCQAQASWTKPSVASLMTSLYSYSHGLIRDSDTIPQGARTLSERLRASGYVTAGMAANPFAGRVSGLDRGFDYQFEYPAIFRRRSETEDRGTDSAALNKAILPWLETHRDERFFLFAQSTDPHAPYRPPARYEALFANPAETPAFNRDYGRLRDLRAYTGGASVSRAEARSLGIDPGVYLRRAIDRYDGEIANNDRSIELVIEKLKSLGLLEKTLVIIASDHGEEFWEHGWTGHGQSLYAELTHAVLLMSNSKLIPAPARVAEPVQLIDVLPTVLDLLGIKPDGTIQGQSLAPLLRRTAFHRSGAVMSSRFPYFTARSGGLPENLTSTFARIGPEWKLIYRDQAKKAGMNEIELYDRRTDRTDARNVAAQNPEVAQRLLREVAEWIGGQNQVKKLISRPGQSPIDAHTLEKLRSLGYLGGR